MGFFQVNSVLKLTKFGFEEKVGIHNLKACEAYLASYPPHDGPWKLPKLDKGSSKLPHD